MKELVGNIGAVLAFARHHPRFRFSLIVGLTLRLDYSVVAVFLSLWAVAQARSAGFSAAEGMKAAGVIFSCLMAASIISPLLMGHVRSEEHTSELQSLMRISYAVFCLKKNKQYKTTDKYHNLTVHYINT